MYIVTYILVICKYPNFCAFYFKNYIIMSLMMATY